MRSRKKILMVGDGDLTLSLAASRAYGAKIDLTASTLQSKDELMYTYPDAVAEELIQRNIPIKFELDATQIHRETINSESKWDMIVFHHPHLGLQTLDEGESYHARRHHILLCHYFASAVSSISSDGMVHVCLCGTQATTWSLEEAASQQGLNLVRTVATQSPFHMLWCGNDQDAIQQYEPYAPQPGDAAPRRYRNGKLGSRHFLGKYGYRHRRTEGERHAGGASDMNVGGSMHYIFQRKCTEPSVEELSIEELPEVRAETEAMHACNICKEVFGSDEKLQQHLQAPALPIYNPVDTSSSSGMPNQKAESVHRHSNAVKMSANEPITLEVLQEFHGKRLRWYLKHSVPHISKSMAESLIKQGAVLVNKTVAVDSSRILQVDDVVSVVAEQERNGVASSSPQKEVEVMRRLSEHGILIVWKERGVRTKGFFGHDTLESMVTDMENTRYQSLSKLDTGCPGLCVLTASERPASPDDTTMPQVVHTLTALVHGRAPNAWSKPTAVSIPIRRHWKRQIQSEEGATKTDDEVLSLEDIQIQCVERMNSDKELSEQMSTITIRLDTPSISSVGAYLRQQDHPIVGDRMCKQEYLSLKRSIRNRLKDKLNIACCCVELEFPPKEDEQTETTIEQKQVPERLSALYWENNFSTSNREDSGHPKSKSGGW